MMIRNSRKKAPQAKQEGSLDGAKAAGVAASSRPWTGLKDPRVVVVARSLGGKDRHSKVSTIRGLRDRRVRLSVPTAIQLYDLQDRLGVNQPSKVVDWLLDAARHEIDKLPPLQFPPGSFFQYPPAMAAPNGVPPPEEVPPSGPSMVANMECREGAKRRGSVRGATEEKDGLFRRIEQEQRAAEAYSTAIPVHGDLHGQSHASMPSILGSNIEHSSYYHMEAPNQLCVPHLGCYPMSQGEELHVYRPAAPALSVLSTYAAAAAAASAGYDQWHANSQQQMGSSASQGFMLSYAPNSLHTSSANIDMRPLQLSISSRHHHSQHNHESNVTEQLL